MGFYTAFEDPDARRELVRYYAFLRRHETLYRANRPHAEVLLLFPRRRVHEGDLAAVSRFKELGQRLLEAHVLFDVLPDDGRPGVSTAPSGFQPALSNSGAGRTDDQRSARPTDFPLSRQSGLPLLSDGSETPSAATARAGRGMNEAPYKATIDPSDATITAANLWQRLPDGLSRFAAPATVRVSASHPAQASEITLHFVNYNREEPADKKNRGAGIKDEKPIAAPPFEVDLRLTQAQRVARVEFLAPEVEPARELPFKEVAEAHAPGARLRFRVPEFLVYGVVRIHLAKPDQAKAE
jgi:hypothetical protein